MRIAITSCAKYKQFPIQPVRQEIQSSQPDVLWFCRKVWFFEQNRKTGHHKLNDLQDSKFIKNKLCDRTRNNGMEIYASRRNSSHSFARSPGTPTATADPTMHFSNLNSIAVSPPPERAAGYPPDPSSTAQERR